MLYHALRSMYVFWLRASHRLVLALSLVFALCLGVNGFLHLPPMFAAGLLILYPVVQLFNIRLCGLSDGSQYAATWEAEDHDPAQSRMWNALGRVESLIETPFRTQAILWCYSMPLMLSVLGLLRLCGEVPLPYQLTAPLFYVVPPLCQAVVWGFVYNRLPAPELTTIRGREITAYAAALAKQEQLVLDDTPAIDYGVLQLPVDESLTHFA